jgi:DNA processing protein
MVRRGITIVSGGARGIDGQAHRTAITGGSATVAVLGCGVDIVYPKEHASLFEQIVHRGALVSEYPFGTLPRKYHFPARNRILAGLCDAVLVTEASSFSGTLITAGFAADYGRDVCAVPGSILSGTSRSCHDLIREGAVIVESIDDIPRIPSHPIHGDESIDRCCLSPYCNQPEMAQNDVSKEEECILNLLASAPRTLRSISEQCHLDLRKTALSLANLQSKGLVSLYRGLYVRSGVVSG